MFCFGFFSVYRAETNEHLVNLKYELAATMALLPSFDVFYFSRNLRERFWDYKKCCGLQVLELSMTGSSCCSAGRPL